MKKILSMLAVASVPLFAATPALAENLNFALVNKTGYTINEVYVSSAATDDWEEDVMGRDTLDHNDRVNIKFDKGARGCKWDVKVVYEDGEEAMRQGFDLCKISEITLRYDGKKGTTWASK